MTETTAAMVAEAKQHVENLTPEQVAAELQQSGVVLFDLREPDERAQNGVIPGAIGAARGMLEFWADPASPYHRAEFDPEKRTILYCASGGRSALGAETLQRLGYANVAHLGSGFRSWQEAGRPVEEVTAQK